MQKKFPAQAVKGLFDGKPPGGAAEAAKRPPSSGSTPAAPDSARRGSPVPASQAKKAVVTTLAKKEDEIVEIEPIDDLADAEIIEDEEVVESAEVVETRKPEKKPPKEEKPEPEVIAEVPMTYRKGYPDLDGPLVGTLQLETTGIVLVFEEEEIVISFEKIENVMEPAKGDFPDAIKSKAFKSKMAGKAGRLAAGMVGNWLGGMSGSAAEKVGKDASKMAEEAGNLGKPPRNRITIIALIRKQRRKVSFDVNGDSRDEMNEDAKVLYKQIQKARNKTASITPADAPTTPAPGTQRPAPGPAGPPARSTGPAPASAPAPTGAKPFRVLSAGKILGPYALDELKRLLAAGKFAAGDLIGVETWLPVATLSGMLMSGAGGGGTASAFAAGAAGAAGAVGEEEEDLEDLEEIEVHDAEDEEETSSPAADGDEEKIQMDAEFKLD